MILALINVSQLLLTGSRRCSNRLVPKLAAGIDYTISYIMIFTQSLNDRSVCYGSREFVYYKSFVNIAGISVCFSYISDNVIMIIKFMRLSTSILLIVSIVSTTVSKTLRISFLQFVMKVWWWEYNDRMCQIDFLKYVQNFIFNILD